MILWDWINLFSVKDFLMHLESYTFLYHSNMICQITCGQKFAEFDMKWFYLTIDVVTKISRQQNNSPGGHFVRKWWIQKVYHFSSLFDGNLKFHIDLHGPSTLFQSPIMSDIKLCRIVKILWNKDSEFCSGAEFRSFSSGLYSKMKVI